MRAAFVVDDNIIGNKKAVKELLRTVIWQERHKYPLTFITEASLDLADDEELIALMDLANIRSVFVGIETHERGRAEGDEEDAEPARPQSLDPR